LDVAYAGAVISQFNANPRVNQLKAMFRVMSYLQDHPDFALPITGDAESVSAFKWLGSMPQHLRNNMRRQYHGVGTEEIDEDDPVACGKPMKMTCFVDSDHAGCKATRRSTYGFIIFLGGTPIYWESKKQKFVFESTYGSELMALRDAVRKVKGLRQSMRALGVKLGGPCKMAVDNMSVVDNTTLDDSALKHLMYGAAYHFIREALCMEIIDIVHVGTNENVADIFTKGLNGDKLSKHAERVVINGSNEKGRSLDKIIKSQGKDIEVDKMIPRVMMIDEDLCEKENNIPELIQSLMMCNVTPREE
jgi:hypothetical protein